MEDTKTQEILMAYYTLFEIMSIGTVLLVCDEYTDSVRMFKFKLIADNMTGAIKSNLQDLKGLLQ